MPNDLSQLRDVYSDLSGAAPVETTTKKRKRYNRVLWTNEMHELFMASIFDIGLKTARPKKILESMMSLSEVTCNTLGTEHVKSHLQKYREKSSDSRDEFVRRYRESFDEVVVAKKAKKSKELRPGFRAYPFAASPRPQPGSPSLSPAARMRSQMELRSFIDDQHAQMLWVVGQDNTAATKAKPVSASSDGEADGVDDLDGLFDFLKQ